MTSIYKALIRYIIIIHIIQRFRSYAVSSRLNGDMKPIQEGVRDMLVKHHLFSWDL